MYLIQINHECIIEYNTSMKSTHPLAPLSVCSLDLSKLETSLIAAAKNHECSLPSTGHIQVLQHNRKSAIN